MMTLTVKEPDLSVVAIIISSFKSNHFTFYYDNDYYSDISYFLNGPTDKYSVSTRLVQAKFRYRLINLRKNDLEEISRLVIIVRGIPSTVKNHMKRLKCV